MLEYSHTIGIVAMEGRGFEYPTDTVVAKNGRMYVLNSARDFGERGVRVTVLDRAMVNWFLPHARPRAAMDISTSPTTTHTISVPSTMTAVSFPDGAPAGRVKAN